MVKHLAFIMDGNRRWAKNNSLDSYLGHYHGAQAAQRAVEFCLKENIKYLSLYTFSLENLKRTEQEKAYIFNLLIQETESKLEEYIQKGIRVKFIGDRLLFPESVLPTCAKIEQQTAHLNNLQVNLLFCYGARQEILDCVKRIVQKIKSGEISEDQVTDDLFSKLLWTNGTPEPDLIIRSGGQQRLSNFLLYQSAYSEFYFLDCLWPDVQMHHFEQALNQFKNCKRNFGV
jgi:undecaprenyl diphosphate synthase